MNVARPEGKDPMSAAEVIAPISQRRPVESPAAWMAADMRAREAEWSYRLSPAEVAELETALRSVQARGLDIAEIRREHFPLPKLGPALDRLRTEVLEGRGFVLLRGVPVEDRPIAESAAIYWGIGSHFGSARSQNAKGHLLGHVYDLGGSSATDPTVRSYATAERQNFHIDRCDVVALLCLRRAKSGGLSAIASSMAVHNVMLARRPDLLERLYQPFPVDRRGEVPDGKAPFYDAPVFNEHAGKLSVLYSRLHIGSAQRFPAARRLTEADIAALDMLGELAGDPELRLDMTFTPGDIQFLHNHTILHARTGYEDWPEVERKRHLLRLWLAPPEARPLPPVFAECYGGIEVGDRGGIVCAGTRLHAPLVPG
jgi:TfdA family taurine catabolism dioxygenase TauD